MTLTDYQCIEYGLYSTALSISSRGSFAHKCRRLLGLIIPKPEAHWFSVGRLGARDIEGRRDKIT
jgi:hypothetical protein